MSSSDRPMVTSHNPGFKFFAWKDYKMVTYNNKTMYAPSYYQTYIVANSRETYKSINLENWTYPELPRIPSMEHVHKLNWGVITIAVLLLLMAGTVGVFLLLKLKRHRQGLNHVPSQDELEELNSQEIVDQPQAIVINN